MSYSYDNTNLLIVMKLITLRFPIARLQSRFIYFLFPFICIFWFTLSAWLFTISDYSFTLSIYLSTFVYLSTKLQCFHHPVTFIDIKRYDKLSCNPRLWVPFRFFSLSLLLRNLYFITRYFTLRPNKHVIRIIYEHRSPLFTRNNYPYPFRAST